MTDGCQVQLVSPGSWATSYHFQLFFLWSHDMKSIRCVLQLIGTQWKRNIPTNRLHYIYTHWSTLWLIDRSNHKLCLRSGKMIISVSLEHYCYCQILDNWQNNMISLEILRGDYCTYFCLFVYKPRHILCTHWQHLKCNILTYKQL